MRFCRRAPSIGAKGCLVAAIVAIVKSVGPSFFSFEPTPKVPNP